MELQHKIQDILRKCRITIDPLDLGITLFVAMTDKERNDLSAMIDYLTSQEKISIQEICFNIVHDLVGMKAKHLGLPAGECFSPRSRGYAEKMQKA